MDEEPHFSVLFHDRTDPAHSSLITDSLKNRYIVSRCGILRAKERSSIAFLQLRYFLGVINWNIFKNGIVVRVVKQYDDFYLFNNHSNLNREIDRYDNWLCLKSSSVTKSRHMGYSLTGRRQKCVMRRQGHPCTHYRPHVLTIRPSKTRKT